MKLKYLLLLAFSVWWVGVTTSVAAPIRAVNRLTTAARFTPEVETADTYRNCQTKSSAVVTVYAGNETGSGSIVSPEGLVITSNHVIKDRSGGQPIVIRTADGEQYRGRVSKIDTRNDLALLQLDAQTQFPIVPLANVSEFSIGQAVCAIGSPYGRPGVLSEGTLSLVRGNGDLQASIRLYPGNSGGPLLNPQGEMIGVNKAILESPSGKNTGISFATSVQAVRSLLGASVAKLPATVVPITPSIATLPVAKLPTTASPVMESPATESPVMESPVTESPATEWTWTAPSAHQPLTPTPSQAKPITSQANSPAIGKRLGMTVDTRNLVVQQVQAGSAAAIGGFRPGDRLLAINGSRLRGFTALQSFLNRQPDTALFTIARGQKIASVQVRF